jgi:hypothetical protein
MEIKNIFLQYEVLAIGTYNIEASYNDAHSIGTTLSSNFSLGTIEGDDQLHPTKCKIEQHK